MDMRTVQEQERYINPYTDFGFKRLFEHAEIAKFTPKERQAYEESVKVGLSADDISKTTGLSPDEVKSL